MKISKFCWGLESTKAVKSLAIFGMVLSVLGILVAIFVSVLPSIFLSLSGSHPDMAPLLGGLYGFAAVWLLIHIGWFAFSFILLNRNKKNDTTGVKKMVKLGSYIIGSIETLIFAAVSIFGIVMMILHFPIYYIIIILVGVFLLIFPCLLLDGIRTKNPGKIKVWIIKKFVLFGLTVCAGIPGLMYNGRSSVMSIVAYFVNFLYCVGMVIVHYNIIIEDEKIAETVMNNITTTETENGEKKQNLEFSNPMSENEIPPPYSEVV